MTKQFVRGLSFVLVALVLGLTGIAHAQFNASLSGTVQDSTQAAIPGATLTLTNPATQQARTTVSTGSGSFSFNELAPGAYTLTTNAKNFGASTVSVSVAAETPRSINVTLQPAGSTQTVTVDADTTQALQTSDASIGSTLSEEQIQRLPAVGGDVYELLRTSTGITGDGARAGAGNAAYLPNGVGPGQSNSGIFQVENQVQISAAGQGVGANDYTIDGVSVNSLGQAGAAVVTPNEESVAQLTVVATSYSAEDGRDTGAHIKVVSKSGTNTIHGSAYFRYDEPGLNSFNHGLNGIPGVKVQNKARDYRGSLGGPLWKDKLFLFSSYEGFGTKSTSYSNQWVETPQFDAAILAQRPGTVSAAIVGSPGNAPRVNALLPATCSYYTAQHLQCAIVGTGIDVGSIGPASANGTYAGNINSGAGLDNVPDLEFAQIFQPTHARGNQWNGRMDWFASQHDQFAVSTFITKLDGDGPSGSGGARPNADLPTKPLNSTGTFIYIHTFSSSLINEFRSNFTRYFDNQIKDAAGAVNFGIPYINIQNLPVNNVQYGVPQSPATPGIFAENTYEVRDAVTKNLGSHSVKAGAEYRWEQDNNNLSGNARPVYAMAGLFNFGNNAPVYEGIEANPTTGGAPITARYLRSNTLGLYVQDDWKIAPNFTLNVGVRYEYFSPFTNKGQELNLPVLGPAGKELITPSLTPHNQFFNSDYTGVEPKIGFAWTPAQFNNKTVIRGGFGRALNRINFSTLDNAVEDGPGVFNYGLCCAGTGNTAGIQYSIGTSNSPSSFPANPALKTTIVNGLPVSVDPVTGIATPIGIEVYGALPRTKIPYAYLFSLEAQQQLPAALVLTVGFQGAVAHHLPRLVNQNFLYSQPTGAQIFNAAYFLQTDSNSSYNALNVRLERQLRHGLEINFNYAYSKSLDQVSNGNGADSLANQTDPARNYDEWGPSDYDTRHRFTAAGVWTIPGTKGGNQIVKVLTNGWQINGIFTMHTGFPFTPVTYNQASNPYVSNAATISPTRPYQYFGGFVKSCSNSNFLTGADTANTRYTLSAPAGSVYKPGIGRNSFTGPCYNDTDMSFGREQKFNVSQHPVTARFQANLYNVFNQEDLLPFTNGNAGGPAQIVDAGPDTNRANSSFGKPTGATAGRVVEFFARVQF
jgi:outer membrane receptor protein involved in Fe transport